MIICLFDLKFNPAYFESELLKSFKESNREKFKQKVAISDHYKALRDAIYQALEGVDQLDHDRVLRRFVELINATLRTNYYQGDYSCKVLRPLAFKFDPAASKDKDSDGCADEWHSGYNASSSKTTT